MSSITAAVSELNNIHAELKRLRVQSKNLNSRKKVLEKEIVAFLEARDQPGLKYQGITVVSEEQESHKVKGRKKKEQDVKSLLRRFGVDDETEAYNELMAAMKGSPEHKVKLKVKKLR